MAGTQARPQKRGARLRPTVLALSTIACLSRRAGSVDPCPTATPTYCTHGGACVLATSAFACPRAASAPLACDAVSESRCADGTCQRRPFGCAGRSLAAGTCTTAQVVCADGSCAVSLAECPRVPACLDDGKPARCEAGNCASSADASACAAVAACAPGRVRCADGTCGATSGADGCAPYDGCPPDAPYRCADGHCEPLDFRPRGEDEPFVRPIGCADSCDEAEYRCASGRCRSNRAACDAVPPLSAIALGDVSLAVAFDTVGLPASAPANAPLELVLSAQAAANGAVARLLLTPLAAATAPTGARVRARAAAASELRAVAVPTPWASTERSLFSPALTFSLATHAGSDPTLAGAPLALSAVAAAEVTLPVMLPADVAKALGERLLSGLAETAPLCLARAAELPAGGGALWVCVAELSANQRATLAANAATYAAEAALTFRVSQSGTYAVALADRALTPAHPTRSREQARAAARARARRAPAPTCTAAASAPTPVVEAPTSAAGYAISIAFVFALSLMHVVLLVALCAARYGLASDGSRPMLRARLNGRWRRSGASDRLAGNAAARESEAAAATSRDDSWRTRSQPTPITAAERARRDEFTPSLLLLSAGAAGRQRGGAGALIVDEGM